jgi:hypothetical protein
MSEQIFEGIWEEVVQHSEELAGKHVRVTVIEEQPTVQPNLAMQEALRKVAERNQGKPLTSGEDTQRMLREARAGKMWGYEPIE